MFLINSILKSGIDFSNIGRRNGRKRALENFFCLTGFTRDLPKPYFQTSGGDKGNNQNDRNFKV